MAAGNLRRLLVLVVSAMLVFPTLGLAATKYKEVEVSGGGSVAGKVSFEGALPEDAVDLISITKNPEVCDKDPDNPGYREVVWVDVEDGALRGVFVFIDIGLTHRIFVHSSRIGRGDPVKTRRQGIDRDLTNCNRCFNLLAL